MGIEVAIVVGVVDFKEEFGTGNIGLYQAPNIWKEQALYHHLFIERKLDYETANETLIHEVIHAAQHESMTWDERQDDRELPREEQKGERQADHLSEELVECGIELVVEVAEWRMNDRVNVWYPDYLSKGADQLRAELEGDEFRFAKADVDDLLVGLAERERQDERHRLAAA